MPQDKITWSPASIRQFSQTLDHIRKDSIQNAEKVHDKIIKKLMAVAINPKACPPDKYKTFNDGTFRSFVLFYYRVSFRIIDNGIQVLRIRHEKMKTKYY
jgi:plasmid stabilization system protein ParE